MKFAHEMPWPPPPDTPYRVDDHFGSYVEMFAPGAVDGAEITRASDRSFIVAEDEWNVDSTERRILKVKQISAS